MLRFCWGLYLKSNLFCRQKDSLIPDEFNDGDEENVCEESDEDVFDERMPGEERKSGEERDTLRSTDESSEELEESHKEGVYRCEKLSCREHGTTFQYPSGKAKHDK